jgi:Protein of unknown function (DUF2911)
MHTILRWAPILTLALASARTAGAQQTPGPRVAASSFASVEVHINSRPIGGEWYDEDAGLNGPARIAISYGQPHARGRKVEGGLIPLDTVWRFGANAATALHTDVDLDLGTLRIPRGDYTLFLLHARSGWQLIVNRRTATWGTDYDPQLDLGRIPLVHRTLREAQESLAIYLVPSSQKPAAGYADLRGDLGIEWGTTGLSTTWRVVK